MQKRLYFRSLFSGYGMVGVWAACSLISVPLALHFLPAEEFGLWAVVLQIGGYFALVDTGISSSVGRLLIDHRAHRPSREYGAVFFGGLLILCALAVVVTLLGLAVLPFLSGWLGIAKGLQHTFLVLVLLQVGITAASLPLRAVGQSILSASRYDLLHVCLTGSIVANLVVLWAALALGAGIFAFAWASFVGLGFFAASQFWAAGFLGCLPSLSERALPGKGEWKPLLAFARDVVFVQVGNGLVFSTQSVIISSTLGLTAVATWAAGSKVFFLFLQLTGKVSEVAGPQMARMHVSGEAANLDRTLRQILAATISAAVLGAVLLILGNSVFVQIWTGGKLFWPGSADVFLGAWLVLASVTAVLTTRALAGKQLTRIRHVYILEGVAGILAALWAAPRFGIPGVAASYAAACLLFSFRATVWDMMTRRESGKRKAESGKLKAESGKMKAERGKTKDEGGK